MHVHWGLLLMGALASYSFVNEVRSGDFQFFGVTSKRESNSPLYFLLGFVNFSFILLAFAGFWIGHSVGLSQAPLWLQMAWCIFLFAGAAATALKIYQAISTRVYSDGSSVYSFAESPILFWAMVSLQSLLALLLIAVAILGALHELHAYRA